MKFSLIILFVGLLASCSTDLKLPDAPKDLIPEDEMVVLIHDMTILESTIQTRYQNVNRYYKVMIKSGRAYLKSKHISEARFERSYDYYVSRPEVMQEIYTKASDSITVELNRMQH